MKKSRIFEYVTLILFAAGTACYEKYSSDKRIQEEASIAARKEVERILLESDKGLNK